MADEPERELPPESTQALLARHRAGDVHALEALILRHSRRIERIVRARLKGAAGVDGSFPDVLQDVYLRIVAGVHRFEQRTEPRWIDWVARLARNEITDQRRRASAAKRGGDLAEKLRRQEDSSAPFEAAADTTAVHSKVSHRELMEIIDRCLGEMSEKWREVILLRDYMDEDWGTISELTGRPTVEACQQLHRRAREDLERRFRARTQST